MAQQRRKERGASYTPITPAHRSDARTTSPALVQRHISPGRAGQKQQALSDDRCAMAGSGTMGTGMRLNPTGTLSDSCCSRQCYVCSNSPNTTPNGERTYKTQGERQLHLLKGALISADFAHSTYEPSLAKPALNRSPRLPRWSELRGRLDDDRNRS